MAEREHELRLYGFMKFMRACSYVFSHFGDTTEKMVACLPITHMVISIHKENMRTQNHMKITPTEQDKENGHRTKC